MGVARQHSFPEEDTQSLYMGVARQKMGVTRQCKFPESKVEGHKRGVARQAVRGTPKSITHYGRATWTMGRATPVHPSRGDHHLGVPLGIEGVARQL
ncbi:hypothetical protein AHAS_Ahas11G0161500 [Arachis hypogaea]